MDLQIARTIASEVQTTLQGFHQAPAGEQDGRMWRSCFAFLCQDIEDAVAAMRILSSQGGRTQRIMGVLISGIRQLQGCDDVDCRRMLDWYARTVSGPLAMDTPDGLRSRAGAFLARLEAS